MFYNRHNQLAVGINGDADIQILTDKLPDEMSCQELSESDPQLYFTNLGVATFMCWAFYNVVVKEQYERSEVYFDILKMTADAKIRTVVKL